MRVDEDDRYVTLHDSMFEYRAHRTTESKQALHSSNFAQAALFDVKEHGLLKSGTDLPC